MSYLSSAPPCHPTSPPPWDTSAFQSNPFCRRLTLPLMPLNRHQLAWDMPASRAPPPPATVNGTAHYGAPGAPSLMATWAAHAPASSALWIAATPMTAPTLLACWLLLQRPWVEPHCQVSRGNASFDTEGSSLVKYNRANLVWNTN